VLPGQRGRGSIVIQSDSEGSAALANADAELRPMPQCRVLPNVKAAHHIGADPSLSLRMTMNGTPPNRHV
jgi:hypothetical protein